MSKLTKRSVDSMAIPTKGQTFLWDEELRGFGVRAMPSGLKVFVLQYRNEEGRSRRIVLGRYGVLTVEQARKQAVMKLGSVAAGVDPAEERAQSRAAITIGKSATGIWRKRCPGNCWGASTGPSRHRRWRWIAVASKHISSR